MKQYWFLVSGVWFLVFGLHLCVRSKMHACLEKLLPFFAQDCHPLDDHDHPKGYNHGNPKGYNQALLLFSLHALLFFSLQGKGHDTARASFIFQDCSTSSYALSFPFALQGIPHAKKGRATTSSFFLYVPYAQEKKKAAHTASAAFLLVALLFRGPSFFLQGKADSMRNKA